jgi:hypothetical protein
MVSALVPAPTIRRVPGDAAGIVIVGACQPAINYALVLVILGNGSLGNSQPLRIGNFLSLSNCQAAAHEAMAIGFDSNPSPGFVCVRIHEDARHVAANSRRDDTKNVTVDTTRQRAAGAPAVEGSSQLIAAEPAKVPQHRAARRGG